MKNIGRRSAVCAADDPFLQPKKEWKMKIQSIYILLAGLLCTSGMAGQARLHIGSSSALVCQGAPHIVLYDSGFESEGELQAGQSTLTFAGSLPGAAFLSERRFSPLAYLVIDRPAEELQLNSSLDLTGGIRFARGLLDLNGQSVFFVQPQAVVQGETPAAYAYGHYGGDLLAGKLLPFPNQENVGGLGMAITAGGNLGYAEVRRGHLMHFTPGGHSISRWYEFNRTGSAAMSMRLHYFDHELNGLHENQLIAWNSLDGGLSWAPIEAAARNTSANWLEISGYGLQGLFTLALPGIEPRDFSGSATPAPMPEAPPALRGLEVFPNPATDVANLRLHANIEGEMALFWFDASGQLVRLSRLQLQKGSNAFTLELAGLPSGAYLLKCGGLDGPAARLVKQ
jgi:hypothetical protein